MLKLTVSRFFAGSYAGLVAACVAHLPSPADGAATKVSHTYSGLPTDACVAPMNACDPQGLLMANLTKMYHKPDCESLTLSAGCSPARCGSVTRSRCWARRIRSTTRRTRLHRRSRGCGSTWLGTASRCVRLRMRPFPPLPPCLAHPPNQRRSVHLHDSRGSRRFLSLSYRRQLGSRKRRTPQPDCPHPRVQATSPKMV